MTVTTTCSPTRDMVREAGELERHIDTLIPASKQRPRLVALLLILGLVVPPAMAVTYTLWIDNPLRASFHQSLIVDDERQLIGVPGGLVNWANRTAVVHEVSFDAPGASVHSIVVDYQLGGSRDIATKLPATIDPGSLLTFVVFLEAHECTTPDHWGVIDARFTFETGPGLGHDGAFRTDEPYWYGDGRRTDVARLQVAGPHTGSDPLDLACGAFR